MPDRTRSGKLLTDELVEGLAAQMDAGIDPAELRPRTRPFSELRKQIDADPERRQRVEDQVRELLGPHPWTPGLGGICCQCSMAARLHGEDLRLLASIGFIEDPIHQGAKM